MNLSAALLQLRPGAIWSAPVTPSSSLSHRPRTPSGRTAKKIIHQDKRNMTMTPTAFMAQTRLIRTFTIGRLPQASDIALRTARSTAMTTASSS